MDINDINFPQQLEYYNHIYWYVQNWAHLSYTVILGARNTIFKYIFGTYTSFYIDY